MSKRAVPNEGSCGCRRSWPVRIAGGLLAALAVWIAASYALLPDWWKGHEARHPALLDPQRRTVTANGIPGDPVNVMIVGAQRELIAGMRAAGWNPADAVTLRSSVEIAESSIFHRAYPDAPVSALLLFGRREDLAFEKPVGGDARRRHHVRFWQAPQTDGLGRPGWWGAATFDESVGFSHTTGQVTHHIAPEVDRERDGLMADLKRAGAVRSSRYEAGFQALEGRNGGGDRWESDGKLGVVEVGSESDQ